MNENAKKTTNKDGLNDADAERTGHSNMETELIARLGMDDGPMKRKLRLAVDGLRTCSAPSSPTGNCSVLDLTWDEDEARSVKKTRMEKISKKNEAQAQAQDGPANLATSIRRIIKKLDEEIRNIAQYTKERNTKKEIKESASVLRSLVSQLTTQESKTLLQTLGGKTGEYVGVMERSSQDELTKRIEKLEEDNIKMKQEIEILTKKNRELEESKNGRKSANLDGQKIEKAITTSDSYDDYSKIEGLAWPRAVYKTAFMANGSPLHANKETDQMVLLEDGKGKTENEGIRKAFLDRYPELEDIDLKMGALTMTAKLVNREGRTVTRERWVIKAEVDEGELEWFKTLKEVKELLVKGGRTKLAIYPPGEDMTGAKTRKMLEFIFRGSGIKCLLYTRAKNGKATMTRTDRPPRKERETDALLIRKEGKTYAELLKTLKDRVKPETAGAKAIRTIRESRDGNMVVVINKGCDKAGKELEAEINRIEELKVTRVGGEREATTIFIRNIDGVTTKEEVLEALRKESGEDRKTIQMGEMRKAAAGYQTTTARIPKDMAKKLIGQEGIRIGLSLCPIRERVEVVRCFRCWKYGHIGRECKGIDESQLCRKCGGSGHKAQKCEKEEYCLTCKVVGHMVGTGKCPEFRKALTTERRATNKRSGQ